MDIPIQNVYFLLCYAWDKLEEKERVDVDPAGLTELVDLFSRVLIRGTNHLLKRGFDRSYVADEAWTGCLRGKVLFDAVAKSGAATATLPCEFDELSLRRPAQSAAKGNGASPHAHEGYLTGERRGPCGTREATLGGARH